MPIQLPSGSTERGLDLLNEMSLILGISQPIKTDFSLELDEEHT